MISKLSIVQYRKLKSLDLNFCPGVNIISGTNGTCKSSILHMISNAYKRAKQSANPRMLDGACVSTIARVNAGMNCKIESLVRGDKKYRDPALGVVGTLFTINYENGMALNFRRHRSEQDFRFAVKPNYAPGTHEKLPEMPVIYLGLPRLLPRGELADDVATRRVGKQLPTDYSNELADLYKRLTRMEMGAKHAVSNVASLKCCEEFETTVPGVDSNTISSGEDNVLCILRAIVSLRYYYEKLANKTGLTESVLLIDELDATLHPSLQIELCELLRKYAADYKIQVICTTHSLTLLEDVLTKGDNVIYFIDDLDHISVLPDPDIFKIRMHLKNCTRRDLYEGRKIPVFAEDDEARAVLGVLLDHIFSRGSGIEHLRTHFHFVRSFIGAANLETIFKDGCLSVKSTSFAVLDGDKNQDVANNLIVLPGVNKSPEQFLFEYGKMLCHGGADTFWHSPVATNNGYSRTYFNRIESDWEDMERKIRDLHASGRSAEGVRRAETKAIWSRYEPFFIELMKFWVADSSNQRAVSNFIAGLKIMFKKTAAANGINPRDWS